MTVSATRMTLFNQAHINFRNMHPDTVLPPLWCTNSLTAVTVILSSHMTCQSNPSNLYNFIFIRKSKWSVKMPTLFIMECVPIVLLTTQKNISSSVGRVNLTLWCLNYFFFILAHPVYKMWIIHDPNNLALWNKLHFEEKKTESIEHV
jgi:hypothetical protein